MSQHIIFSKSKRKLVFGAVVVIALLLPLLFRVSERVISVIADQNRLVPIYYVDTEEKKVALSFDACWGATRTLEILKILRENDIKTTFFLTGYWIADYPHLVRRIHEEGHEIGNHTYTHPHLNSLSAGQIRTELEKVHEMIRKETGQEPFLFRPPFGEYNNKVIETAEELGYITIQWSVDSLDWQDISKDAMVERVTTLIHPGAIVLMHNNGQYTADALPEIIEYLQQEGYQIVPISALIYRENYYIDSSNGAQKRRPVDSSS